MIFVDYLVLAGVLGILGLVVGFLVRSRKRGRKCIGCPDSGACGSCCCCDQREQNIPS